MTLIIIKYLKHVFVKLRKYKYTLSLIIHFLMNGIFYNKTNEENKS